MAEPEEIGEPEETIIFERKIDLGNGMRAVGILTAVRIKLKPIR